MLRDKWMSGHPLVAVSDIRGDLSAFCMMLAVGLSHMTLIMFTSAFIEDF